MRIGKESNNGVQSCKLTYNWILSAIAILSFLFWANVSTFYNAPAIKGSNIFPVMKLNTSESFAEQHKDFKVINRFSIYVQEKYHGKDGFPVVLTYSSFSRKDMLLNWLLSLIQVGVDSYIIVCLDEKLHDFLKDRGVPCFLSVLTNTALTVGTNGKYSKLSVMNNHEINKTSGRHRSAKNQQAKSIEEWKEMNQIRENIWKLRISNLLLLLQGGIDVVLSDCDTVWTRNALKSRLLAKETGDLVFSRAKFPYDLQSRWGATACMGISYFAATARVIEFVKIVLNKTLISNDDQVGLNKAIFELYDNQKKAVFENKLSTNSAVNDISLRSDLPRLVLVAHTKIPRFCDYLDRGNWKNDVEIAHCHPSNGKSHKGESVSKFDRARRAMLSKHNLWCELIDEFIPQNINFFTWANEAKYKCDFAHQTS